MIASTGDKPRRRGRPPRSEPPRSALLIQAALKNFAEEGFSGASLRQIAAEAGVDVALIAHSFGTKADLWKAVIDDLADRLWEAMRTVQVDGSESTPPCERLRRAVEQIVDITCDTAYLAQFLVKEITQTGEKFDYIYDRLARPMRDLLVPLIREARRQNGLLDVDEDFLFITFNGAISITVAARPFLNRLSQEPLADKPFREKLIDVVFAQVLSGPAPRSLRLP